MRAARDRGQLPRPGGDRRRGGDRLAGRGPTTATRSRDALVEAVNDPEERRRRGANAREVAVERYAWPALAERVAAVYETAQTRG